MTDLLEVANPLSIAAVGAVVVYILTHLARKAWQNVTEAALDTQRELAESNVLTLMRAEMARMSADISAMRNEHNTEVQDLKNEFSCERATLYTRVRELEVRVETMTHRFSSIRMMAMDVYHLIGALSIPETSKEQIRGVLSSIIYEGDNNR